MYYVRCLIDTDRVLVRDISRYFIFITKPIMVHVAELYMYKFLFYPDGIKMYDSGIYTQDYWFIYNYKYKISQIYILYGGYYVSRTGPRPQTLAL